MQFVTKHERVAFNDKLLSGPERLQRLFGILFASENTKLLYQLTWARWFVELLSQTTTADVNSFSDEMTQSKKSNFTTSHDKLFGAKKLPTSANYALYQLS